MSNLIKTIMDEQRTALSIDASKKGTDNNCPFTGSLKLHGKVFTGIVVSKDTHRTARVEWYTRRFINKYERFMVLRSKVAAHNPAIINAAVGDQVVIAECRPISKTKKFVIIKNLGHSKAYMIKKESIEEDKKKASDYAKKHEDTTAHEESS